MKYDNTDIHLRYDKARKLPDDTIVLWFDAIIKHVSIENIKTIIDLGCGTGRFIHALMERFSATVYGLDPSVKMLTKAKADIATSRVIFIQSTAEYLCFANDSVDLIFLSQTYHHFQDKDKAISETRRVLRRGGFFCIRNSTIENLDSCLYLKFFPRAYKDNHKLLPSRMDMTSLLNAHKLIIVNHDIINYKVADSDEICYEKTKLRAVTDLALLSDDEFNKGLKRFETYCRENDSVKPVYEEMDLFVCKKK
jgi:ubiquinone/menaquinone biosynthesis C-methylase UbiE